MHDCGDISCAVSTLAEELLKVLQIRDGIEVRRGLFASKAAIQVAADSYMAAVPCKLTNMVDVIYYMDKADRFVIFFASHPARADHPIIECRANHSVTVDDRSQFRVVELALMRDKRPAVVVAGKHGSVETIQRLPKGFVR